MLLCTGVPAASAARAPIGLLGVASTPRARPADLALLTKRRLNLNIQSLSVVCAVVSPTPPSPLLPSGIPRPARTLRLRRPVLATLLVLCLAGGSCGPAPWNPKPWDCDGGGGVGGAGMLCFPQIDPSAGHFPGVCFGERRGRAGADRMLRLRRCILLFLYYEQRPGIFRDGRIRHLACRANFDPLPAVQVGHFAGWAPSTPCLLYDFDT